VIGKTSFGSFLFVYMAVGVKANRVVGGRGLCKQNAS